MKEYLTYSLVSKLALFQVFVSSSHLKVQILSKLMLLTFLIIDSLVASVQSLTGQSLPGVLLLEKLGWLDTFQLLLGLVRSNADGSLSMSAWRDSYNSCGFRSSFDHDSFIVSSLRTCTGRLTRSGVPWQRWKGSCQVAWSWTSSLSYQDPIIRTLISWCLDVVRKGRVKVLTLAILSLFSPDVARQRGKHFVARGFLL